MKKRGDALLLTLLMLAVVAPMVFAVGTLTIMETRGAGRLQDSIAAYYAAEAGIEESLLNWKKDKDNVPDIPKQNLTNLGATCTTTDCCYTVDVTDKGQSVGNFDQITDSTNPTLLQDNSIELDLSSNKPDDVFFKFNSTSGAKSNLPSDASCRYGIEVTYLLNNDAGFTHHVYCENQNQQRIFLSTGATTLTGSQLTNNWGSTYKIRIKPINTDIQYAYKTSNSNGLVPLQQISIKSTGEYNQTKRTLEIKLDRNSGKIIGLFDFVIYAGSELRK